MSDDTQTAPATDAAPAVVVSPAPGETPAPSLAPQQEIPDAVEHVVAETTIAPPVAEATVAVPAPVPNPVEAAPSAETSAISVGEGVPPAPSSAEAPDQTAEVETPAPEIVPQPFAIARPPFSLIGTVESEVTAEFVAAGKRAKALITELEGLLSHVEIETAINDEIAAARSHLFNFAASVSRHLGLGG